MKVGAGGAGVVASGGDEVSEQDRRRAKAQLCPETRALPKWKTGQIWFDLCVGIGVGSSAVLCCG